MEVNKIICVNIPNKLMLAYYKLTTEIIGRVLYLT